jgi:hypothetical protein
METIYVYMMAVIHFVLYAFFPCRVSRFAQYLLQRDSGTKLKSKI